MGVEVNYMLFSTPEFLHTSYALEDKTNVSLHGGMNTIKGVHELLHMVRLFYLYDLAFELDFLIKLKENRRTGALTVGKTIQDGKIGIFT